MHDSSVKLLSWAGSDSARHLKLLANALTRHQSMLVSA